MHPPAALIRGVKEPFQVAARGDVEFGEHPGEMGLDGLRAQVEPVGDLLLHRPWQAGASSTDNESEPRFLGMALISRARESKAKSDS